MKFRCAELDQKARYKPLIGLVYPRPILLVSTVNANGVLNAAPFSFFNVDLTTWRVSKVYRPIGRLYGDRYCTTRQRFDLPGPMPA